MRLHMRRRLFIASMVVSLGGLHSTAEVSVEVANSVPKSLVVIDNSGGGDDPNPWPTVRTHIPAAWILNPSGGDNVPEDGAPSFAWNGLDQTFEVVWAQHDGNDFEIVLSRWEAGQWTAPVALTSNSVDDSDPVIAFAPDGTTRIVYQDNADVLMLTRPPSGGWGAPTLVDLGRLPSTAPTPVERAAFQRPGALGATEILAAVNSGSWQTTLLHSVTFAGLDGSGDLDVRIHSAASRVWIVWEDSATQLGWSQLIGSTWTSPQYETIAGPADEEAGRLRIELTALQ